MLPRLQTSKRHESPDDLLKILGRRLVAGLDAQLPLETAVDERSGGEPIDWRQLIRHLGGQLSSGQGIESSHDPRIAVVDAADKTHNFVIVPDTGACRLCVYRYADGGRTANGHEPGLEKHDGKVLFLMNQQT
jgi:hypothetical protein